MVAPETRELGASATGEVVALVRRLGAFEEVSEGDKRGKYSLSCRREGSSRAGDNGGGCVGNVGSGHAGEEGSGHAGEEGGGGTGEEGSGRASE